MNRKLTLTSQVLGPLLGLALATGCAGKQAAKPGATAGSAPAAPAAPPVEPIVTEMTTGPSEPAGNNLLWNGDFDEGTIQPWSATFAGGRGSGSIVNKEACLRVDSAGAQPFDVVLRQRPVALQKGHKYQVRFKAHSTAPTNLHPKLSKVGPPYTAYWSSTVQATPTPTVFTTSFEGNVDDENTDFVIEMGGPLAGQAPFTICFDEIQINDPEFKSPEGRSEVGLPKVRVNQVGYLPKLAKIATAKNASPEPQDWELVNAAGKAVAKGKTIPFGEDRAAGEVVHQIDFSTYQTPGKGYKLRVGKDESFPFEIGENIYEKLKYDALAFYYHQRSGIEIKMPYAVDPKWERPAGHLSDKSVPCAPESNCSYSLDVSGGWYDAGDHGKYVVNGGISLWTLQNQWETLKYLGKSSGDFADGKMNIPEKKNGAPDLLDEARWEAEWMLKMQVPAGQPMAGMAHQRMHDEKWTPLPTMPHQDPEKRILKPVATAATLNLAASAAQTSRLWKEKDPAFAKKALQVAETAWAAAKANPKVLADAKIQGGGAYGDALFDDEFFWAAAELFITTGKPEYKTEVLGSKFWKNMPIQAGGTTASMSWEHVAALGKISLAVVPNGLSAAEVDEQRRQIVGAADKYLGYAQKRGYRMPLQSDLRYPWGSNSPVLNNAIVMGLAYYFTKDMKYANGAAQAMDYILGRNPKSKSYVSGYGEKPLENPHHRIWAPQKDPKLPGPPPGILSGGPNSSVEDPYAKQAGLGGCPPQKCYVDHVESYSTNEVAINWNAPLAWTAAFLDEIGSK